MEVAEQDRQWRQGTSSTPYQNAAYDKIVEAARIQTRHQEAP